MHCWIELSRAAILHNYTLFTEVLGKKKFLPVLKSNAYGHGLAEIFSVLKDLNLPWIGVNYLYEASLLRRDGFQGRILNLGPIVAEDLEEAARLNTEVFIDTAELYYAWRTKATRPKSHLKIDTGLSRRGFYFEDLLPLLSDMKELRNEIVGIVTHFANVEDVTNTDFAHLQLKRLLQVAGYLRKEGFSPLLVHAANSASSLLITESRLDLCRVGISFYGLWASEITRISHQGASQKIEVELKPVLSWKTKLTSVKMVPEGEYVGYGCTFKAPKKMKIGVISVGYFEGYPRVLGGKAYVLIKGRRCSILGRICMNMAMVDLDNISDAAVGDTVTLLGKDQLEQLTAEQLASWAGTINYEIVTRLNPLVPRIIVH